MSDKKRVDFINLNSSEVQKKYFKRTFADLIDNSIFIGGNKLKSFERNFSKFTQTKYCLGVANGTDALEIAIESLELPKNSEIIVPNFTFLSPAEAVLRSGFKLVLADVQKDGFNIDLDLVERNITRNTSAIILVHLFGYPCDLKKATDLSNKYGLRIIEDCSQAHGAKFENKNVGSFGDVATFSFYPTKNLGAFGDSGSINTNSKKIFEKAKLIATHGRKGNYDHIYAGRNSRLDTIQAAILDIKLKDLIKNNKKREKIASKYESFLGSKVPSIELFQYSKKRQNVYHQFPLLTNRRDDLIKFLKKRNIYSGIYYPKTLHKMNAFKNNKNVKVLETKNSTFLTKNIVSLPMGPHMSLKDANYVLSNIKEFFN